jgi:hypothetical protein
LKGSSSSVPTGIPRHRLPRAMPGRALLGFTTRVGVVFLLLYLLGRAFGVRWEAGGRLVAGYPATAAGVRQNVSAALGSLWAGVVRFLDPVVAAYGPAVSLALVGVLLIGIGYWVLVRG